MKIITEHSIAPGEGWSGNVSQGQVLRLTAKSVVDFIAFKKSDPREYFDVARTRIYNLNIYPTKGQRLFSKQNNPMMRMLEDGFQGIGRHDLQSGHGLRARMLELIAPLGVRSEDLPNPLGFFRNLEIDQHSGAIRNVPLAPPAPVAIDLEAEIDLFVALTNCPDSKTSAPGAPATIAILAP